MISHTHSHIHSPKSDTCRVCDNYKVQTDAESDDSKKAILMGEWDLHKAEAECAYQQLKEDTALSCSRSDLEVLTFDLEQSLPINSCSDYKHSLLQETVMDLCWHP